MWWLTFPEVIVTRYTKGNALTDYSVYEILL
jgi:hypothetical protein